MIADALKLNLNALETAIKASVKNGIIVTRDFKDIGEYSDFQLLKGVVNIISTGVERKQVGLLTIDRQKIVILCWLMATSALDVEEKEIDFLQSIEGAIGTMDCTQILSVVQSSQKEAPYGHLGIDLEIEME